MRIFVHRIWMLALLPTACMFLSGCGGASSASTLPPTVPASGNVTLDGKPLADALVRFTPMEVSQGVDCVGTTGADGKYELVQAQKNKGAPAGKYKVTISLLTGPGGKTIDRSPGAPPPIDQGASESLPAQYSNVIQTKLIADVTPQGGEYNFELKSK